MSAAKANFVAPLVHAMADEGLRGRRGSEDENWIWPNTERGCVSFVWRQEAERQFMELMSAVVFDWFPVARSPRLHPRCRRLAAAADVAAGRLRLPGYHLHPLPSASGNDAWSRDSLDTSGRDVSGDSSATGRGTSKLPTGRRGNERWTCDTAVPTLSPNGRCLHSPRNVTATHCQDHLVTASQIRRQTTRANTHAIETLKSAVPTPYHALYYAPASQLV
jgi:hypothetical protein